jgi:hypothetical protein
MNSTPAPSSAADLGMGNLAPGMSRSLWKRSEAMPIRGLRGDHYDDRMTTTAMAGRMAR